MLLGNALCNVKVTELRYAYKQLEHKLIAQRLAGWHPKLHTQGSFDAKLWSYYITVKLIAVITISDPYHFWRHRSLLPHHHFKAYPADIMQPASFAYSLKKGMNTHTHTHTQRQFPGVYCVHTHYTHTHYTHTQKVWNTKLVIRLANYIPMPGKDTSNGEQLFGGGESAAPI